MEVDHKAPAIGHAETEIAADPETVWDLLADIDGWPSWNPAVSTASLDGELRNGARMRWKAGPGTITSTFQKVDRPRELAWTGKTMGIAAVHVYTLRPVDAHHTVVTTAESWAGLLPRLASKRVTRTLQDALDAGLGHLKAEAERRASA
jgi:hypothetical protein